MANELEHNEVPDIKPDEGDVTGFFGLGSDSDTPPVTPNIEPTVKIDNVVITEPVKVGDSTDTPKSDIPPEPVVETPVVQPTGTPAPSTPSILTYTQEQIDELVNNRVTEEVKKFESINTFFDEFQKNPYEFMAKNSPHLFEKFDANAYVLDKIKTEFGEFEPDPKQALMFGTRDYQYAQRVNELVGEARTLQSNAKQTIEDTKNSELQAEQSYRTTKALSLGMDISDFDSKIWNKVKEMGSQNVLDALVDSVIYKDKLEVKNKNLKEVVDLTKGVPSPVTVGGGNVTGDKDTKFINNLFGFDKDLDF
jgi:hypothetical protein